MENGTYSRRTVDLTKWEIKKFVPFLFDSSLYGSIGCGYSVISTLTGESPFSLKKKNKNSEHCSDEFVIKRIKLKGFKVLPITKCLVSNTKSDYIYDKIKDYHCLLMSQLYKKAEASWTISVFGKIYHNYMAYDLKPLEFVNRPIVSAFLISRKDWK